MKNFTRTLNDTELEIVCGGASVHTKDTSDKGSLGDIEQNPTPGQQDPPQSSLG